MDGGERECRNAHIAIGLGRVSRRMPHIPPDYAPIYRVRVADKVPPHYQGDQALEEIFDLKSIEYQSSSFGNGDHASPPK